MSEYVYANARCGRLRGSIATSIEGYKYCSFKGIPYAKPPVGELRFQDPVPAEPWSGVRDATEFGSMCGQYDYVSRSQSGCDDCLYLNLYVRSVRPESQLPVMVWIHGGAFLFGSADDFLYGPDYLLRKDIVLVTFNYRLGVLGFLNLDDEVAPGNQGFKDQIMVLKWVQENISQFGGDPNNVTLFGESAGSVSVHYLALSDLTKGLFHKAILQSGVACNTWACSTNKRASYEIAEILGCRSKNPKELVKFLRTVDCEKLIEAQEKIRSVGEEKLRCTFAFGPGIDVKSKTPVVPIHPSEALKKGIQIPVIIGYNDREGIFSLAGIRQREFDQLNKHLEDYLVDTTKEMMRRNNLSVNDLKRLYFGREHFSEQNIENFVNMWTDLHFIEGIHRVVRAQVRKSSAPTYLYRFTYDKDFSLTKSVANTTIPGASHFDEVQYLFKMNFYDLLNVERPKPGSAGRKILEQMVEMWYNFAKYGRPTPEINDLITTYWLPVTDVKTFRNLNINEDLRMESTVNIDERFLYGVHTKTKL